MLDTGFCSDHLTDAGLRALIEILENQDVDTMSGDASLVIPPSQKNVVMGIDRYVSSDFRASKPVEKGMFGNVYGIDVFVTSNCATVLADDSTTAYRAGLLFHRDALVLVKLQDIRTQVQNKLEHLGSLFVADTMYGVGELRDYAGVAYISPS